MWPKTITVKGIRIDVDDAQELAEIIAKFGSDEGASISEEKHDARPPRDHGTSLAHTDRALLEAFIEGGKRGLPNSQIAEVLGKQGKAIRSGLEQWGRRIGLVDDVAGVMAFEPVFRADGRGYRLKQHFIRVGSSLLGG